MPMPTGGAWPPPSYAAAYARFQDWSAWYDGNPDNLREAYEGRGYPSNGGVNRADRAVDRYVQRGGVLGKLSRWLWGAPVPVAAGDTRLHVPLASDLASAVASLVFSEPPTITAGLVGEGELARPDPTQQAVVERILDAGLISTLRHGAEAGSAFGEVYLRPVIDREVSPNSAITSVVHADQALPVYRWGKLVEITFWSMVAATNTETWRLLEHHEPGRITYALFLGNAQELGKRQPLDAVPGLGLPDDLDAEGGQDTLIPVLDVVRMSNAGPQRSWRRVPNLKYYGRSDFDGNEQVFDAIDQVWTSWMRDIRIGAGRISVPAYMMEKVGVGDGAFWDADREIYRQLTALPEQNIGLTVSQFAIRHVEHKATSDALMEAAMRHAGVSAQTLGEEGGDVAMTATESQARERLSFVTRGDRTATAGDAIRDYLFIHTLLEWRHGIGQVPAPLEELTVEFGDSVSESPETQARTLQMLVAAEAISITQRVKVQHPEWEPEQIALEVARIKDDSAAPAMPAPDDELAGGEPAEDGPAEDEDVNADGGQPDNQ